MNDFIIGAARQLFRADSPRTHAPRPALGFRTGISQTLSYPGYMENLGLAVASDGSIWGMTSSMVGQYSPNLERMVKVCDCTYYNPSFLSFAPYLAPVSNQRAFFIQSNDPKGRNEPVVCEYLKDRGVVQLPALPDKDKPAAVSAASDGSLWVLGRSGRAWNLVNGSAWQSVATEPGFTLEQISVGAADFVLAVGRQKGISLLLRLDKGKWIKHDSLDHSNIRWVGACEGKEYWWTAADFQHNSELHLVKAGEELECFAISDGIYGASAFTAATTRACYFFSPNGMCFMRAALGVIDQKAQDWPSMNAGEKKAYDHISTNLGIIDPQGLRSQYTNVNAAFSIWFSRIEKMQRPSEIGENDWTSTVEQLKDELEYVQSVTTLSVNIGLLNGMVGQIYTNTYNQVIKIMELPDNPAQQPKNKIDLVLDKLLGKLEGAVIGKAKQYLGSEVVDIGMACFKHANDQIAKKHQLPDGSTPLIIACSELAATLSDLVVSSEKARAQFQQDILSDWGKLGACGEAIRSGVWFWSPGLSYEKIADASVAIALNFYQTLMPVKWKIILVQGVQTIRSLLDPFMHRVPRYSLMFKYVSDAQQNRVYWWWACAEIGAEVQQQTPGPFPNQKLMETIFALETKPLDFFSGNNGWKLPVVSVPGYGPPPDGAPWQDYVNSPAPF